MIKKLALICVALIAIVLVGCSRTLETGSFEFTVTIENVSGALEDLATPLAPGVFAVHSAGTTAAPIKPLFAVGSPAGSAGLEALAEDGNAAELGTSVAADAMVRANGVFNTPVGADGPGVAMPGASYQFSFKANKGDRLSFATMYVQSNDLFFGPAEVADIAGIDLFPNNFPLEGDITSQIAFYDAGTEVDQPLHTGPDQAPRQGGTMPPTPDTGGPDVENADMVEVVAADGANIMLAAGETTAPVVNTVVKVTVTWQ